MSIFSIFKDVLEFSLTPLRDRLYKRYDEKRQKNRDILHRTLERIKKERPNFEHLAQNKPYSSSLHKKAVEECSFDLLSKDISQLTNIRKYKNLSEQIIQKIEGKKVNELPLLLNKLELKIVRDIK